MKSSEFHSRRAHSPFSLFAFIDTRFEASCVCITFAYHATYSRIQEAERVTRLMQSYVTGRGFYSSRLVVTLEVCQCEIFVPFVYATSDSLSTVEERQRKRIGRHASLSLCVSFTPLNTDLRNNTDSERVSSRLKG